MFSRGIKKFILLACLFVKSNASLEDVKHASMDVPLDPKFGTMFEWAKKEGVEFEAIELRHQRDSMRGMFAKRDIKKGEVMLFVPDKLVMSLEKGKESYFGKIMTEKKLVPGGFRLNAPTMAVLAIGNMQENEKGADSEFYHHLQVQPGTEDFPVNFSEEERSYLTGSPFLDYLDQEIEDIRYDYSLIARDIPEFGQKYSKEDYNKAKLLVISRNFGVTSHGVETNIQVPIADMFNTKVPKNSLWYYDDQRNGFIVEAVVDIKQGEQLFDSYGKKCNYRFFLNYAFINLDDNGDNAENEFPLFVGLNEKDEQFDIKKEVFLDGMEKTVTEYRIVGNLREKVMHNFLSWMRFVVYDGDLDDLYETVNLAVDIAKKEAIKNGQKKFGSIGEYVLPINLHNEVQTWQKIKTIAQEALDKYPTTLEQDYGILSTDTNLTYNTRNCVLLRVGEKKILHFMKETADILIEMSKQGNRKKAVRYMMKNHKALKQCMKYVKDVFIPLLPTASEKPVVQDEL